MALFADGNADDTPSASPPRVNFERGTIFVLLNAEWHQTKLTLAR
ncbi:MULTISPECIES: hypothetical protein [unclassified Microcoleus]|nr:MULTISPECIES: hypothetical protein [unclassified Microcoleus]